MLKHKTAIVTGGARGIGLKVANVLLDEGYKVLVSDIDETAVKCIKSNFENNQMIEAVISDVSDKKSVEKMIEKAIKYLGEINTLVNNAGIQTHFLVENMPEEKWDETIDINLKSVFLCSKGVIPYMKSKLNGKIINISSMSSVRGSYEHAHYCASKAGIIGFTKALAKEVGKFNITVNAVCPGIIDTRMISEKMKHNREKWLEEIPLKKFGKTVDVANLVAFLSSDKASWITGQAIHVNGGIL
ncbi:MAG: SDR family NAD(P)-dependent oxidoreductase [Kosmotogaceae bacterium]